MGAVIGFADLGEFIDQPVYTYFTGMRVRLGFSVALQTDPDVVLIDETIGVGDAKFKAKSTEAMKRKVRSDKTIVLVSHSPPIIEELCDRVVCIEEGRTRMAAPPGAVLAGYKRA
jgi:lipopolysaccharide transport system ATP-binding protein